MNRFSGFFKWSLFMNLRFPFKINWWVGCGGILFISIVAAVIIFIVITNKVYQDDPSQYLSLMKKDNFVAPKDNIIREEDLKNYFVITTRLRREISALFEKEGYQLDWNMSKNYLNLFSRLYDIRKIQAAVLKQQRYSIKKYKWINRQIVVNFGGKIAKQMNILIRATNSSEPEIDSLNELKNTPQENLDLFFRYEDEIKDALTLWILGL